VSESVRKCFHPEHTGERAVPLSRHLGGYKNICKDCRQIDERRRRASRTPEQIEEQRAKDRERKRSLDEERLNEIREQQRLRAERRRRRQGVPVRGRYKVGRDTRRRAQPIEKVENTSLREAVLASDKSLTQIADECGWNSYRKNKGRITGDSARLKRALGIIPSYTRGKKYYQHSVTIEVAERLIAALGIDPWEVGL
jgi:hypothetical protein